MIDPAEVERYRLPEADNQRIFRERITPDLMEGCAPQETPTVVFLVGQPGAGKSRVTEMVAAALNQHGGFATSTTTSTSPTTPPTTN
ncbi:zeta toxin family protein [Streptomyces zaomyceticus]|uniref:zeta toxin family protein n=1 Tax=Streptomyces zaomyceticus TaxID=68286 RepID=UPI003246F7F3